MFGENVGFESLVGKFLTKIEGLEKGSELVTFYTDESKVYKMCHDQGCCEYVRLEDINGFSEDVIGQEILMAEESTSDAVGDVGGDSATWTFYRLATLKGWLVLRWLGESNGYYSEGVDIYEEEEE